MNPSPSDDPVMKTRDMLHFTCAGTSLPLMGSHDWARE